MTCLLEKGPLTGSGGLDVRVYAQGISNANQEKGVSADLQMNIELVSVDIFFFFYLLLLGYHQPYKIL